MKTAYDVVVEALWEKRAELERKMTRNIPEFTLVMDVGTYEELLSDVRTKSCTVIQGVALRFMGHVVEIVPEETEEPFIELVFAPEDKPIPHASLDDRLQNPWGGFKL